MEDLATFIFSHSVHAHWILFGLIMLAGLNIPISEDIALICGGLIARSMTQGETLYLYTWLFLGCWISAWEAYALGRFLGPKLYRLRFIGHSLTEEKVSYVASLYQRWGFFLLLIGRFIPFGFRNVLFMTAGITKVPFKSFTLKDLFPSFLSSAVIFFFAREVGKNLEQIAHYTNIYHRVVAQLLGGVLALLFTYWIFKKYRRTKNIKMTHHTETIAGR